MNLVRPLLVVGGIALTALLAGLLDGSLAAGIVAASGGVAIVLGGIGSQSYGPFLTISATAMLTTTWLGQRPPWLIMATLSFMLMAFALHLASPLLSQMLVLAPLAWTSTPVATGTAVLVGVLGTSILTFVQRPTLNGKVLEIIDLRVVDLARSTNAASSPETSR